MQKHLSGYYHKLGVFALIVKFEICKVRYSKFFSTGKLESTGFSKFIVDIG